MKTVIEMAGEVDAVTKILLDKKVPQGMSHDVFLMFLERFAALVREEEREACAKLLEQAAEAAKNADPQGFVWRAVKASAEVIRARGQA